MIDKQSFDAKMSDAKTSSAQAPPAMP